MSKIQNSETQMQITCVNLFWSKENFTLFSGVRNQKESLTTFPLSNVKWTGVTRMEVVIKLSSKTRNRTIADLDQTTTLFFYKERNGESK